MRLNDEELREVLARAEEIQRTSITGPEARAEMDVVIAAAQEVGIAREAVERAFLEKYGLPARPLQAGELAFARSADGKFYVAEVLAVGPDDVRVRFLKGSEHVVAHNELKAARFLPGEKVMVQWPSWGPWSCTVLSYDAGNRTVTVNDGWMETATIPVSETWLNPPKAAGALRGKARVYATLLGTGAALGTLGTLLTMFFLR